eukprot:scaffold267093_cov18-Tisochrysis_lutea.AAC.2
MEALVHAICPTSQIRCKVVKNKVAPPFRFDRGIDGMGGLVDAAESAGVLTRRGSYYYYKELKLGQMLRAVVRCSGLWSDAQGCGQMLRAVIRCSGL